MRALRRAIHPVNRARDMPYFHESRRFLLLSIGGFSSNITDMRISACMFLSLLLVMANIVMAMDIHAESMTGQHSLELHADNDCDPGDKHPACHHCCHAQAHFCSLPQRSNSGWPLSFSHEWTLLEAARPHPLGYAPPVPPPKA